MTSSLFKPKSPAERRIFFPWEGRGTIRQFLVLGRVGPVLVLSLFVTFVFWVSERERHAAGVRVTMVALQELKAPVERYLLENEGKCPPTLDAVVEYATFDEVPRDGWGRSVRLVCPSDRDEVDFVLMSDGPDGRPGGLDRVEL